MKRTLQQIAGKFNKEGEPWVLAGNTAAVLQGAMIQAHKLTFYTSRTGSYKFNDVFAQYKKEKVKYRELVPLVGHTGLFFINDIEVRILGEPGILFQHRRFPIPIEDIYLEAEYITLSSQEIPLLPLPWLVILGLMGNDESLARGAIECGIQEKDILAVAENMGVSYYLKPSLDALFQTQK